MRTAAAARPALRARFYASLVIAGLVTYLFHELAHWSVGRAVGLDVSYRLNGVMPTGAASRSQLIAMSAAGPVLTIAQTVLAYGLVRRNAGAAAFAFLLWGAFMRVVASGISMVHPNDEARIGMALGIGYWTLPVVVSVALCTLAWVGALRFDLRRRDYLYAYLTLSAVSAAIVFGDRYLL